MNKNNYTRFFQAISDNDKGRRFNFTAGHIGAFSNIFKLDKNIKELDRKNIGNLVFLCTVTKLIFLLTLSIIPFKNVIFFIRGLLRKVINKNINLSKEFAVISVGYGNSASDPYLSKILLMLNSKFDYFKIVGGKKIKTKEFIFFEQALGIFDFLKCFISIFLVQYLAIFSLISFLFSKNRMGTKFFFLNYCLEEITSGALYNNYLLDIFGKKINKYGSYKKVIFPMEGRNWEKKIVSNLNKFNCKVIGYIHCAITPFHLSLTSKNFYDLHETPSIIITPSSMAFNLVSKIFINSKTIDGSFIRDNHVPNNLPVDKKYIIFVLTSYIPECEIIINSIVSSGLHNHYKVEIKLHPDSSTHNKVKKMIIDNNLSLFTGFSNTIPLACLFRSSSTAIEYLRVGINPVYINLKSCFSNNIFDLDNLYNFTKLDIHKFDSFVPNKVLFTKKKCIRISNYYLRISNPINFMGCIKD